MHRNVGSSLAIAGALVLAACASTKFNTSWTDPNAQPLALAPGAKVVAMVISPNESTRRGAEVALAAELNKRKLQAIPAYSIIPVDEIQDREKAKARVEESGAEAVVVMQATGQEKEYTSSPGMYMAPQYGGFWGGYYAWGWGLAYSPGYLTTDTYMHVETLVYDLKQNKLVWAGMSETKNPSRADAFIRELVDESAREMRKQGLIR
jgi:hypothetical protein